MTKRTNSAKQLSKIIRKDISNAVSNKRMWDEVGNDAVEFIRGQMVEGKGVASEGGQPKRFDDVSDGYKKFRERNRPPSTLSPKRGFKSKLIYSGKMFNDLAYVTKKFGATLGFKTKRSAEIAEYHDKSGAGRGKVLRPFFNLSKNQLSLLKRVMATFINKDLN